jgi:hypothetical protein
MLPLTIAASVLAAVSPADPAKESPGTSLTIYSSADPAGFDPQQFAAQQRAGYNPQFASQVPGFGIVRQTRSLAVQAGTFDVPFTDVAAFIDPTTVGFVDLTDPSTTVLEQNFQFDLVSPEKLYEKYLGREIKVDVAMGDETESVQGTLLSANQGQFVLQTKDGVRVVPAGGAQVQLGELPGGLLTKPTLVWKLNAKSTGDHLVRTTYQTSGMTWRADYNLVLDASDTSADLSAWVTLLNLSGASFPDTQLKLVAGEVQRIQPQPRIMARGVEMMAMADAAGSGGFEEKQLFEYHLYTLPRKTDVLANTSQQIALFPPKPGVKVAKELVLPPVGFMWNGSEPILDRGWGVGQKQKVGVFVSFRNDEKSGLGLPLPKGKIRAFKRDDADGSLEFVGEDLIDHTPRNETVRIKLGDAFDVTAERTQVDFTVDTARRTMTESWRVTLKNAKTEAQVVDVREALHRWTNWEITAKSLDFTRLDARTVRFAVTVPADGESTLEYTVKYTW